MIQFAGQNPVTPPVPGQEHHLAPRQLAGQKTVRGRAEGRLDLDPLLAGEAFDMIQPAAADNANTILRHAHRYSRWEGNWKLGKTAVNADAKKQSRNRSQRTANRPGSQRVRMAVIA